MLPVLEEIVGLFRSRKDFDLMLVKVAGLTMFLEFRMDIERTKATFTLDFVMRW